MHEKREFLLRSAKQRFFLIGRRKRLPVAARTIGEIIFESGQSYAARNASFKIVTSLNIRFAALANAVDVRIETETKLMRSAGDAQIIGKLKARRVELARSPRIAADCADPGNRDIRQVRVRILEPKIGGDLSAKFVDNIRA